MEFDEMKKIWDTQNNEPLYVLDETAMHNRILSKKQKTRRITNFTELMSIAVNIAAGALMLGTTLTSERPNVYLYVLAAWMMIVGVILIISRVSRINGKGKFDRSVLGDLDYTLATATYQVRISGLLRWNIVPVAALITVGLWNGGRTTGFAIVLLVFFAIVWYASGLEHNYYKRKRREVEALRKMVLSE
jgi:hypothetical protein